jgi:hypothetical protein
MDSVLTAQAAQDICSMGKILVIVFAGTDAGRECIRFVIPFDFDRTKLSNTISVTVTGFRERFTGLQFIQRAAFLTDRFKMRRCDTRYLLELTAEMCHTAVSQHICNL